ncbi:MAG: ATP-binding cassette domain-containing protein, partial [Halanaerobiales bacterium]
MQALIKVNQLTKEFVLGNILSREKILAVDQVSFEIKPAEIFTLAGESGCGKTTVARMLLGFEEPTAGEIIY